MSSKRTASTTCPRSAKKSPTRPTGRRSLSALPIQIDSQKIAVLLRGGMLPQAYVYPAEMRATRDLLRRRIYLMRKRAELLTHVQQTNSQYNLPEIGKKIAYKANRPAVAERFADPDRLPENCRPAAWRYAAPGLCLSRGDAGDPRSA